MKNRRSSRRRRTVMHRHMHTIILMLKEKRQIFLHVTYIFQDTDVSECGLIYW